MNDSGKLVIYGIMDGTDFINIMLPYFKAIYPWVNVQYEALDTADISTRAISEYQAGHVTADIIITAGPLVALDTAQGVIQNTSTLMEELMNYPTASYDPLGFWHPSHVLPTVVLRNTNLYPTQQIFKYEDLADSKWYHKIAMDAPASINTAGGLFVELTTVWNETYWTSVMEAIAANNPVITPGAGDTYNSVKIGEYPLGLGFINDFLAGRATNDPVAIDWISPTVYTMDGAAMTKGAPHPSMAKLFLQYWVSYTGQASIAASSRIPAHQGVAQETILKGVYPEGLELLMAGEGTDLWSNPDKWVTKLQGIFGSV